jgi:hypothetical protein
VPAHRRPIFSGWRELAMNKRTRRIYSKRLEDIFIDCEKRYSKYGFDSSELLRICTQEIKNFDEIKADSRTLHQIEKKIEKLHVFTYQKETMKKGLAEIKIRSDLYLDERRIGYPNPDRVLFGVMRYFLHFGLEGEALYIFAVGVCVYTGSIKSKDFGLKEDHPSRLFDVFGNIRHKKRLIEQVRKRFDRIFEKYDDWLLEDWDPKLPRTECKANEEEVFSMQCELDRQSLKMAQDFGAHKKERKRDVSKSIALIGLPKNIRLPSRPPKRRRIK